MLQSSVPAPTHYFFLSLQKNKVLSLSWQLCILEQAPVDQVSREKPGVCACISCLRPNRSLGSGDQHIPNYSPVRMLAWETCCQGSMRAGPAQQAEGLLTRSSFSQKVHCPRLALHWQGPHFLISGHHPGCSAPACSPLLTLAWPDHQQYHTSGLLLTPWRLHTNCSVRLGLSPHANSFQWAKGYVLGTLPLQLEHSPSTSDRCHRFPQTVSSRVGLV